MSNKSFGIIKRVGGVERTILVRIQGEQVTISVHNELDGGGQESTIPFALPVKIMDGIMECYQRAKKGES